MGTLYHTGERSCSGGDGSGATPTGSNNGSNNGNAGGLPRFALLLVCANAALYALFMLSDGFRMRAGDGSVGPAATPFPVTEFASECLKYAGICVCLAIALLVLRRTPRGTVPHRRDAGHQVAILAFTLVADFFLLFGKYFEFANSDWRYEYLAWTLTIFCVAHAIAIHRYGGGKVMWVMLACAGLGHTPAAKFLISEIPALGSQNADYYDALLSLIVLYAALIIAATVTAFVRKQARANNLLSRLGMALFVLCDMNVFLWNAREMGALPDIPAWTYILMWAFYLPAQTMLALSAWDFGRGRQR
ncbi:MAG: hypothetical protein LBG82_06700 [Clostridiales Family XIII bacterium]|jgi:hypothetical protein|nr:hypothetical protein [Clostridiales Family XIII bacterium]